MDWQLKPPARESVITGSPFADGDQVVCFLYTEEGGELGRADLLESELEGYEVPGTLLARWSRTVKNQADEEKEARVRAMATSEELFLSMVKRDDLPQEGPEAETSQTLIQILALMLERRRVLKPNGSAREGKQSYRHVSSGEHYEVAVTDLKPERILMIEQTLNELIP